MPSDMAFSIAAEMPLGTYRGRGADGRVDRVPSVSRLHSALLCAAGFGPRAQPRGDVLAPCEADEAALRWLEENPPDAVTIPALQVNVGRVTAWREDGTVEGRSSAMSVRKLPKRPDMSVAVDGEFRWTWSQTPPPEVVAALEALCPDVPSLGMTESPVRLTTSSADGSDEPTHCLDREAGFFTRDGGEDVEIPLPGRMAELTDAHAMTTRRIPTVSRDRFSTSEVSSSTVPPRDAVALARYSLRSVDRHDVPWPEVLMLPLGKSVPVRDRVRFSVAAHRGLIRAIGYGAPPLITGVYPHGQRPANRLAIQVVDESMPVEIPDGAPGAIVMMIPQAADPVDLEALGHAVTALTSVRYAGREPVRVVGRPLSVSGHEFWSSPVGSNASVDDAGPVRLWTTTPAAVPDTRGLRDGPWTFAHAALLSLGFVWRDRLGRPSGHGDARYREMVDAVSAAGVAVTRAAPLRTSDVRHYVHSVNEHAVVRPYHADLWLGDLCGQRTVQAIGQSRHLGGGLLVPADFPAGETPMPYRSAVSASWT